VDVLVAKPLSLLLYGAWLGMKYLVLKLELPRQGASTGQSVHLEQKSNRATTSG
jgi:hypothetical protein